MGFRGWDSLPTFFSYGFKNVANKNSKKTSLKKERNLNKKKPLHIFKSMDFKLFLYSKLQKQELIVVKKRNQQTLRIDCIIICVTLRIDCIIICVENLRSSNPSDVPTTCVSFHLEKQETVNPRKRTKPFPATRK